jgi:hypothetical protein
MQNSISFINNHYSDEDEYDSLVDDDLDELYDSLIYSPNEPNLNKFCIAFCELYNEEIHGQPESFNNCINYYYLVHTRFKELNMNLINDYANYENNKYLQLYSLEHNIFQNYRNMILNGNYFKPEIIECFFINDYYVAIIKTIWIKIIQRKWKNILIKRKEIIIKRKLLSSILYREKNGRWPIECLYYPTLQGMLSNLIRCPSRASSRASFRNWFTR